jgi:hypothetical protein
MCNLAGCPARGGGSAEGDEGHAGESGSPGRAVRAK